MESRRRLHLLLLKDFLKMLRLFLLLIDMICIKLNLEDEQVNDSKTLELLGYNDIKREIKGYAASNLGKKLADEMMPNTNPSAILTKYDEVREAVSILRDGSGLKLGGINDITPYISKIEVGKFLRPEELLKSSRFLQMYKTSKKIKLKMYEFTAPRLYSYSLSLESFKPIENEIEFCIEGCIVHSRASNTLEKIRKKNNSAS